MGSQGHLSCGHVGTCPVRRGERIVNQKLQAFVVDTWEGCCVTGELRPRELRDLLEILDRMNLWALLENNLRVAGVYVKRTYKDAMILDLNLLEKHDVVRVHPHTARHSQAQQIFISNKAGR